MSSRTTLHLSDGRSLPVSRSALDDALAGLSDGASLRLETRNGAWMKATRAPGGVVLSYRLEDKAARYEGDAVALDAAVDLLQGFAHDRAGWKRRVNWVEVEPAWANPKTLPPTLAAARASGPEVLIRYVLFRRYAHLALAVLAAVVWLVGGEMVTVFLVGSLLVLEAVVGWMSGSVAAKWVYFDRDESPLSFWFFVALHSLFGTITMAAALYILTRTTS